MRWTKKSSWKIAALLCCRSVHFYLTQCLSVHSQLAWAMGQCLSKWCTIQKRSHSYTHHHFGSKSVLAHTMRVDDITPQLLDTCGCASMLALHSSSQTHSPFIVFPHCISYVRAQMRPHHCQSGQVEAQLHLFHLPCHHTCPYISVLCCVVLWAHAGTVNVLNNTCSMLIRCACAEDLSHNDHIAPPTWC